MRFWSGVAVGMGAMYFLDPQLGAERRARARETYQRLRPTVASRVEAAEPVIRDLGGRVRDVTGRVPALRVLRGGKRDEDQAAERPASQPHTAEQTTDQVAEQTTGAA